MISMTFMDASTSGIVGVDAAFLGLAACFDLAEVDDCRVFGMHLVYAPRLPEHEIFMKILRTLVLGLLPLIALALGFQVGTSYEYRRLASERTRIEELYTLSGSGQTVQTDPEQEVDLSLLWGVWRLMKRHYVAPEELQVDTMVFGAVSGRSEERRVGKECVP